MSTEEIVRMFFQTDPSNNPALWKDNFEQEQVRYQRQRAFILMFKKLLDLAEAENR